MNGYAAGDRFTEYALLVTSGYTCAYTLSHLFGTPQMLSGNAFMMLACSAAALLLPCFFKRAARVAAIVSAAVILFYILFRVGIRRALFGFAPVLFIPGYIQMLPRGYVTNFLCLLAVISSLIVYFCGKSRIAITFFWAANVSLCIFLAYTDHDVGMALPAVTTACCAVLFIRIAVSTGLAGLPEKHRLTFRTTMLAAAVSTVAFILTQYGYTGLHAAFASTSQINIANVSNYVKNSLIPASTTGFGDYAPNRPLGQSVTPDNTLVLEVQADGPFYLRGRIYDTYTGSSWQASEYSDKESSYAQSRPLKPPGYLYYRFKAEVSSMKPALIEELFKYEDIVPNPLLQRHALSITTKTEGQTYLFLPGTTEDYQSEWLGDGIRLRSTYPDEETEQPMPMGTQYSVSYVEPDRSSDAFEAAVRNATADTAAFRNSYAPAALKTQCDAISGEMTAAFGSTKGLSGRTLALARSITKGCTNEFQKADAIEKWLRANCSYTLSPPQPKKSQDFIDHFLFDSRQGYCEHFATAMTLLLRASGVPARYVEGYASPSVSGSGLYEVTNAQAHAWVEYYSYLYGFITADPTPSSALPRTLMDSGADSASSSKAESSSPASSSRAASSHSQSSSSAAASSAAPSRASGSSSARGSSALPYWAAAALFLLLLSGVYGGKAVYRALWLKLLRRQGSREQTLSLYAHFCSVFARLGFDIPPCATPYELADMVRGKIAFGRVSFDRVTQVYVGVRFGNLQPAGDELDDLLAFHRALPAVCKQKLGKIKYLLMYPLLH